ncbi:hypothetical protein D9M68_818890 [compost metagenome]
MIRAVTVGGGQFDHLAHHRQRVAGAAADAQVTLAQGGDGFKRARDQRRVLANLGDLQRHEALIDRRHIAVRRQAAEAALVTLGHGRLIAEGADVIPLAHAHRAARLLQAQLDIKLGEGLDEDARRREGTEVDHGAGPIEDGGLQASGVLVAHGQSPNG